MIAKDNTTPDNPRDGVPRDETRRDAVVDNETVDNTTVGNTTVDHTTVDGDTADNGAQHDEVADNTEQDAAPVGSRDDDRLFGDNDADRFRTQWRELQAAFVDDPAASVRNAQALVEQMMRNLTDRLTERGQAAAAGDDSHQDTEQLRQAMQRYRTLFDRMLAV